MKTPLLFTGTAIAAAVALMGGCQSPATKEAAAPKDTLVAVKVASAPNPTALDSDPAWGKAQALQVGISDGKNFANGEGATDVTFKAVYTDDMLYMLIQYKDPTDSKRRGPYQKQADGSWKKLVDPENKGGDDNIYYEDKWAFIWPINDSIKGFNEKGCMVMCHKGETKPFGNKYTATEGELGDIWHMKGSRTAPWGFVDDQYVDHTRYDAKNVPNAGRKSDPGNPDGDYINIKLVNGKPEFMNRDGKPGNAGGTYYIKEGDQVPFDDARFKAGDEVASYIANQLKGDRADIKVVQKWSNGVQTSVMSRKLVTGSKYDVQFDKLDRRYAFGFAAFDNAQVRHATTDDVLFLSFKK